MVAVAWVLFVPGADWLARHDVGSTSGPALATARDAARGRLLTLGAGLLAAGALLFTARNFTLSREGQVTDRYTKAVEQLGSDKLDVRIGGIYALERIARDSAKDHPTVMAVLTAFVREHSREQLAHREQRETEKPWSREEEQNRVTRSDVQAALTVIGRRVPNRDTRPIDLAGAILDGADLAGANLTGADLVYADLVGASLNGADLANADLTYADLSGAILDRASLVGAVLEHAKLAFAGTLLTDVKKSLLDSEGLGSAAVNLEDADLTDANLSNARLRGANLHRAILTRANLERADLRWADLTFVNLQEANLTGTELSNVKWLTTVPIPEGWKRDARSRLLSAADTTSEAELG